MRDVVTRQVFRDDQRLAGAQLGQLEALEPAVEHPRRVVDFPVAQQMHDRALAHFSPFAAAAAAGSAAAMTSNVSSVIAALTNHASNALGGAYTPRSSRAWKNAGKRPVSVALTSAKFRTGPSVKNTLIRLPANWTWCGTSASASAWPISAPRRVALASSFRYVSGVASRRDVRPAATATGFPDSVPAW